MAKKSATLFVNFVLILSAFFLLISIAEGSRFSYGGLFAPTVPTAKCNQVYGVEKGDTCFSVIEQFKLTKEFFGFINPNLECDRLFIGQWLCIAGETN